MSILDQINIAIQDQTGNNHPPQRVIITKTYTDNPNLCDIQTRTGNKLTKIPVQGTPTINTEAILIYEDGDQNKPIIITNTDTYTRDNIDNFLNCLINKLGGGGSDDDPSDPIILTDYDVDLDMLFTGVSGRDDSITLKANIIYTGG